MSNPNPGNGTKEISEVLKEVDKRVQENRVKFDDSNVVEKVQLLGMDDAYEIEPVARTTPTYGQKLTILQQLFGNIGRFTKGETKPGY